jgi:hypothetical protein
MAKDDQFDVKRTTAGADDWFSVRGPALILVRVSPERISSLAGAAGERSIWYTPADRSSGPHRASTRWGERS